MNGPTNGFRSTNVGEAFRKAGIVNGDRENHQQQMEEAAIVEETPRSRIERISQMFTLSLSSMGYNVEPIVGRLCRYPFSNLLLNDMALSIRTSRVCCKNRLFTIIGRKIPDYLIIYLPSKRASDDIRTDRYVFFSGNDLNLRAKFYPKIEKGKYGILISDSDFIPFRLILSHFEKLKKSFDEESESISEMSEKEEILTFGEGKSFYDTVSAWLLHDIPDDESSVGFLISQASCIIDKMSDCSCEPTDEGLIMLEGRFFCRLKELLELPCWNSIDWENYAWDHLINSNPHRRDKEFINGAMQKATENECLLRLISELEYMIIRKRPYIEVLERYRGVKEFLLDNNEDLTAIHSFSGRRRIKGARMIEGKYDIFSIIAENLKENYRTVKRYDADIRYIDSAIINKMYGAGVNFFGSIRYKKNTLIRECMKDGLSDEEITKKISEFILSAYRGGNDPTSESSEKEQIPEATSPSLDKDENQAIEYPDLSDAEIFHFVILMDFIKEYDLVILDKSRRNEIQFLDEGVSIKNFESGSSFVVPYESLRSRSKLIHWMLSRSLT